MSDPSKEFGDPPWSDFGEPEAEFRTSYGLPAANALIMAGSAVGLLLLAALDPESDAFKRFVLGSVGVMCSAVAYWIYQMRKWRLWICPHGVIQQYAWGSQAMAWAEVCEVVAKRWVLSRNPKSVTLKRKGPGDSLWVTPMYCNRPHEAVVAVLKAAQDRQIAVRTETVWER